MGMIKQDHLGFLLPISQVEQSVFVPKYYNPEIDEEIKQLRNTHN